jgi:hypoxanthine-guanine phosphoribosyltransferase
LSEDHRRKTVIILGSGCLPFMSHPLLDEIRASAQSEFMSFASDQIEQRGTVQFNYVLQIDNGPQTALRG